MDDADEDSTRESSHEAPVKSSRASDGADVPRVYKYKYQYEKGKDEEQDHRLQIIDDGSRATDRRRNSMAEALFPMIST